MGSLVSSLGHTGEEEAWAKQIVAAAGSAARMAPPTSLLELIELARGARHF